MIKRKVNYQRAKFGMLIQFYVEESLKVFSYLLGNVVNLHFLDFSHGFHHVTYE